MDPQELGNILSNRPSKMLLPLSFLALLKTIEALSLPRERKYKKEIDKSKSINLDTCKYHPKLKNLFLKRVKLKKRHEISLMAEVVVDTALQSGCNSVIDFGSGLGHLVRVLAYRDDMNAAGIECQAQLTEEARSVPLVCISGNGILTETNKIILQFLFCNHIQSSLQEKKTFYSKYQEIYLYKLKYVMLAASRSFIHLNLKTY